MTSRIIKVAFAAMFAAATASATVTDELLKQRAPRTAAVQPGQWHADLEKARAYAEANGLPLVAVWSNGDFCQHCLIWEGCANSPVFVKWMKSSGMVFYFGCVTDGYLNAAGDFGGGPSSDGKEGYHGTSFYWCCRNQNSTLAWPYIRFYWPKGGVDMVYTGSATDGEYVVKGGLPCMVRDDLISANPQMNAPWVVLGDYGTYNPGGRFLVDFITNSSTGVLRKFSAVPAYAGGEFAVKSSTDAARACLEVEKNTTLASIAVPLVRNDSSIRAYAATNRVVCTYPSGKVVTNSVFWAAKQKTAEMSLGLSQDWLKSSSQTPTIKLELYDRSMAKKATLRVAIVDPVANSPANPLWLGERTADSLGWGEWTMDIDVATAKVAKVVAAGKKAYTLVLVGGSLWCPDCYALDEYLIDKDEFKKWAADNNVACVAIDEPIFTSSTNPDAPTLLSHESFDSKTYGTVSGSGWLSRHGVPLSGNGGRNAATVLARNLDYVNKDTDHGGLCLPEPEESSARKTGGWKTGVPGIVMMRSDGSVFGRIYQFSNDGRTTLKSAKIGNLIKRLDELLAQSDANSGEERNDSISAKKPIAIGGRDRVGKKATLSFTDQADYYKIDAPEGTDVLFELTCSTYSNLTVSIVNGALEDPDSAPVASGTNTTGQASIRASLPSANCFLKVSYPVDDNGYPKDKFFALGKSGSTLCAYTLVSDSVFVAQDTLNTQSIDSSAPEVTIALTRGQSYKFNGLAAQSSKNAALLSYDSKTKLWTAKTSGAATLELDTGAAVVGKIAFGYQKWNPGTVGFVRSAWTVSEKGDDASGNFNYLIGVSRTGGVSGKARAKVVLSSTTAPQDVAGSVYEWNDVDLLEWPEGSDETKTVSITIKGNPHADGLQNLSFDLKQADIAGDAAVSGNFTLTIEDDDEANSGMLALVTAGGAEIPANRKVVAKAGSSLKLGVSREKGADGALSGIVAFGGATGRVAWNGRDTAVKTAEFTVPAYNAKGANTVLVTLSGLSGASVDSAAKYLTVEVVPASSVEFEESSATFAPAVRNVRYGPRAVNVKKMSLASGDASKLSVSKISGSFAPGLEWVFDPGEGDAGAIVFSGTPTRVGSYSATYQLFESGTPGGTVTVSIQVADPAAAVGDKPAVNPHIAAARTFRNVMVVSNDCLVGLMTVTVPPSGRLSAKYRPLFGTDVSLMSESWSECDDGDYIAELDAISEDAADCGLTVTAKTDGSIAVKLRDSGEVLDCIVPDDNWSSKKPASAWKGYYTVSLPVEANLTETRALASGAGYATLRMTASQAVNSGKMTYAGVLPDGKAFSGMSVLAKATGKDAILPVVWGSGADRLSAVFVINQSADKYRDVWPHAKVNAHWVHAQPSAASASYVARLGVYGALYESSGLNMESCCLDTFNTQYLTFFAEPGLLQHSDRFKRGAALAWPVNAGTKVWVRLEKDVTRITLKDSSAAKENNGLTFSFNLSSGIVTGNLRLDFNASSVTAKYRGVVLPGWGVGSGCADCTDSEYVKRPFISGACWFNDEYVSDGESATVRRGCPISVGVTPGQ